MEPPDPSIRNLALCVVLRAVLDAQHEDQRGYLAAAWLVSERAAAFCIVGGLDPHQVQRWVYSGFTDTRRCFGEKGEN